MKALIALMLISSLAWGADPDPAAQALNDVPTIYKVSEPSTITLGDHEPLPLPVPSYIYTEAAHKVLDQELKRLQYIEKHPPVADVNVKGWMIGMAIVSVVFFSGGIALGVAADRGMIK